MIHNEEKIIERFGHWPTFHDAEIRKAELISIKDNYSKLELEFYVYELTDETNENGIFKTKNNTVATILFDGVRIDQWKWSSDLDTIFELKMNKVSGKDQNIYAYEVEMPSVVGGEYGLWFSCKNITVKNAVDYNGSR